MFDASFLPGMSSKGMAAKECLHLSLSKHSFIVSPIPTSLSATLSCWYCFTLSFHPTTFPSPNTHHFTHIYFFFTNSSLIFLSIRPNHLNIILFNHLTASLQVIFHNILNVSPNILPICFSGDKLSYITTPKSSFSIDTIFCPNLIIHMGFIHFFTISIT